MRSASDAIRAASRNLNPANQMRPTDVGAFILQSVAGIPPPLLHLITTRENPRKPEMKRDLNHGDRTSLE
jgi:hypothetical protein